MGLARRRHDQERKKAWAKKAAFMCGCPVTPRQVGRLANSPAICSNYCCGRFRGQKTIQEQRQLQA